MMQPWGQRHSQLLQGENQAGMRGDGGKRARECGSKKKEEGEGRLALHTYRRAERGLKSAACPHFISQLTGKWLLNTKTECEHSSKFKHKHSRHELGRQRPPSRRLLYCLQ